MIWNNGSPERDQISAGMVLQMRDGKTLLVGDVNEVLGVCDDCHEPFDDVVAWGWADEEYLKGLHSV